MTRDVSEAQKIVSIFTPERAETRPGQTVEPLSGTKTVLVAGESSARKILSNAVRNELGCRVIEANGLAEGKYLAAVEERIHLLLIGSGHPSETEAEFTRWFQAAFPEAKVLMAAASLWEFSSEPPERLLMAKSYTREELVAAIRRLLNESARAA